MNKFEILAQAKTRRAKCETQVRVLSYLAIPTKTKKTPLRSLFCFILKFSEKRTHEVSSTNLFRERSEQ